VVMMPLFEVELVGELDRPRLEYLRKLLDLEPMGRLTDTEDAQFGHRALRDTPEEWVWLGVWRHDAWHWQVSLTYMGPRPEQSVIDRCEGEVLGAAAVIGLEVTTPARVLPVEVAVPDRRALSLRLGTFMDVERVESLRRALGLNRELGGVSGREFGWRYLRRDPGRGSLLWQLFGRDRGELTLLYDVEQPTGPVLRECRQRAEDAAARAGVAIVEVSADEQPTATSEGGRQ
jgi:hypothetical protein